MITDLCFSTVLTDDTLTTSSVRIFPTVYLRVEFDRFEDSPVVDEFLCTHTGSTKHRQSSVLEFPCLHVSESLGIGWFETKRIETNVPRIVVFSQFPQSG